MWKRILAAVGCGAALAAGGLAVPSAAEAAAPAPVTAVAPAEGVGGQVTTAALGVDGMFENWGTMSVGLICGVITSTYNYVLLSGHNTPNTLSCQGYYVPPRACLNLMRWHDGEFFYSAVNVGRGQHFIHLDGVYVVMMRPVPRPDC